MVSPVIIPDGSTTTNIKGKGIAEKIDPDRFRSFPRPPAAGFHPKSRSLATICGGEVGGMIELHRNVVGVLASGCGLVAAHSPTLEGHLGRVYYLGLLTPLDHRPVAHA